jgi:hypothetical protein
MMSTNYLEFWLKICKKSIEKWIDACIQNASKKAAALSQATIDGRRRIIPGFSEIAKCACA